MIIETRTLERAEDARRLPGWQVISVMFGRTFAQQCDSSESADRVWSDLNSYGAQATILIDGKPTN